MLKLRGLDKVMLVRLPHPLRCLGPYSETAVIRNELLLKANKDLQGAMPIC